MLEISLSTPARIPFPAARDLTSKLLSRVRGGKISAHLDLLRASGRPGKKLDALWLLAPKGEPSDAADWARSLGRLADNGTRTLIVWVAGADGPGPEVLARADRKISLGPATMPSWLACLVAAERIYRADTLLRGTPYHRG